MFPLVALFPLVPRFRDAVLQRQDSSIIRDALADFFISDAGGNMPMFWLVGGCTLLKLMPHVFTFKFAKTDKNINSVSQYIR